MLSFLSRQSITVKAILAVAALALVLILWLYGVKAWNHAGNWLFSRQINAERAKVQKELDDAAAQKKVLEQTLFEYAQSKKELAEVKAEKDRLEQVFNDKSKTASEKVAEFKKIAGSEPQHTATDGVTINDLCQRAKAANASAATIAALCN